MNIYIIGPGGWNDFDFIMTGGQVTQEAVCCIVDR